MRRKEKQNVVRLHKNRKEHYTELFYEVEQHRSVRIHVDSRI